MQQKVITIELLLITKVTKEFTVNRLTVLSSNKQMLICYCYWKIFCALSRLIKNMSKIHEHTKMQSPRFIVSLDILREIDIRHLNYVS